MSGLVALVVLLSSVGPAGAVSAERPQAQGSIAGTVTDTAGAPLPGVTVALVGARVEPTVTDTSGRYRFPKVPPGTYTMTATLAGFVTARREHVRVRDEESVASIDFALCAGPLDDILWVVPKDLAGAWRQSSIVASVVVTGATPVTSECPAWHMQQSVRIVERFKGDVREGDAIAFLQEIWRGEPVPYRPGQTLIVFLTGATDRLSRVGGPHFTYLVEGDHVRSAGGRVVPDAPSADELRSKLRALAAAR